MPVYILDNAYLNKLCYFLTTQTYTYYPVSKDYLTDLYNNGCRPMELLTISLWTWHNDANIELQPLKGNSIRHFTKEDLTENFYNAIRGNYRPYDRLSLRQLESVTKKIIPVAQVSTTKKSAISYIYRYNYVKRLHDAGMTDDEIATKMGWSTALLSASYRGRIIQSPDPLPPLPPVPAYFVTDSEGNFLADNSGNKIIYQ